MLKEETMPTLLRIDASARFEASVSREVADAFEARWRADHPDGRVVRRDLARAPLEPHPRADHPGLLHARRAIHPRTRGCHGAVRRAHRRADGGPTPCSSARPSTTSRCPRRSRRGIDQVTRIGVTFGFEPERGLVRFGRGETRRGGRRPGAALPGHRRSSRKDHLRTYLEMWMNFLGIGGGRGGGGGSR